MIKILLVGAGGFVGAVLRYLAGLIPLKADSGFPIKTFAINVLGAFVIGIITALVSKGDNVNPNVVLMLQVGLCGGFTTFSTFAYESFDLMKNGSMLVAVSYMALSVVFSVLAVFFAHILVK